MASKRDLVVDITGNPLGFERAVKSAQASARVFERELEKLEKLEARQAAEAERAARRRMEGYTALGGVFTAFGAVTAAGLGLATRAAIEWESAWTGVTKTVDGSPAQMKALEGELRTLARTLPATHTEIAAVAEAAGQLGVKRDAIVGFTKVMIDLGNTTNLTSDEAANALARMANIMGTSQRDIDKMGSSLVALGNSSAATEAEILEMSLRIAGAGKQINLSEGEVFGFAAALSSVGVQAEAGGSSISRAMILMSEAVANGGDKLKLFAHIAGMTTANFQQQFKIDAAGAITAFISGLGQMQKSGGNVFATLDKLGMSEILLRDAMLRLSSAGDLVSTSIKTGNQAWIDNNALTEEANKRYQTTASRMQVARNQIADLGITAGETFLPIIGSISDGIGSWLEALRELPPEVTQVITVLGVAAGAATLAAGAFFLGVPRVAAFKESIGDLGPRGQAAARGLSAVTGFLTGPWGAAIGAGVLALGFFINRKAEAAKEVREFTRAIEADSGKLGSNTREVVLNKIANEDLDKKAKSLGINIADLTDAIIGNEGAHRRVVGQLDAHLQAMQSNMLVVDGYSTVQADASQATKANGEAARVLKDAITGTNGSIQEAAEKARLRAEGMREGAAADSAAATAAGIHANAQGTLTLKMGDAESASKKLKEAIDALTGAQITADEKAIRYLDALQRVTEVAKENGRATDFNTQKGRENVQTVIDASKAAGDHLVALLNEGFGFEEVRKKGEGHREQLIKVASQITRNRDEAQKMIDRYFQVPKNIDTEFRANTGTALAQVRTFADDVNKTLTTIRGSEVTVRFSSGMTASTHAQGGEVDGPGTETSDSIPAWLSRGEHVWTAREVRGVGGHGNVLRLRKLAAAGMLPAFAQGGPVDINIRTAGLDDLREAYARTVKQGMSFYGGGGAGVQQWASMVLTALGIMGQPSSFLGITLRRMNQESGGNASVVNRWDSNWLRGTPSVGLMQVIGPTYQRFKHPGFDIGPYLYGSSINPLANTLASMRYALARYGSLPAAYNKPGGYDTGGMLYPGQSGINGTRRPERVLSPSQTAAFERLVTALTTRTGAGVIAGDSGQAVVKNYQLTVYNAGNSEVDLRAQFRRLELLEGV